MKEEWSFAQLKNEYREYLSTLSIGVLRSLGRAVGVYHSTVKKKAELIEEIIKVDLGEIPAVPPSKKGAPIKDRYVDPLVFDKLRRIKFSYLAKSDAKPSIKPVLFDQEEADDLVVSSPDMDGVKLVERGEVKMVRGRIMLIYGAHMIVPEEAKDGEDIAVIPDKMVDEYSLRVGNTVVSHVERRGQAFIAIDVLSINELIPSSKREEPIEEREAVYPWEAFQFNSESSDCTALKYLDWLVPIAKGQRCLIAGKTSAGKNILIKEMLKGLLLTAPETQLFMLSSGRAPEETAELKKLVSPRNLICPSYEDAPELQVKAFDRTLEKLKELVEDGGSVCLFIDSITSVARAYNESGLSLGGKTLACGLESKTLQYVKKYFGSARCFLGGGSLTVIATADTETGDGADDVLLRELNAIANCVITLSSPMCVRGEPTVDLSHSETQKLEKIFNPQTLGLADKVRALALSSMDRRTFFELVKESNSLKELSEKTERFGKA